MFEKEQQVCMDQGMWRIVSQIEGIPSQSPSVVQATARYPALFVVRHHRTGDQLGPRQEQDHGQKPIYFVNKVLQGPEVRYQAIEKAALTIVFPAPRLRHYFQSFTVIVMTDLPIRKVLQKPDVVGRMVRWVVELS